MCKLKLRRIFLIMFVITSCIVCSTFVLITILMPASILSIVLTIIIIATLVATVSSYILQKEILNIKNDDNNDDNEEKEKVIPQNIILED